MRVAFQVVGNCATIRPFNISGGLVQGGVLDFEVSGARRIEWEIRTDRQNPSDHWVNRFDVTFRN